MSNETTFAVTLVKPGPGIPVFEVGSYRYAGGWLPVAGDIITITKASDDDSAGRDERLAYVTRVDPTAETPIRVTEARGLEPAPAPAHPYIVETQRSY